MIKPKPPTIDKNKRNSSMRQNKNFLTVENNCVNDHSDASIHLNGTIDLNERSSNTDVNRDALNSSISILYESIKRADTNDKINEESVQLSNKDDNSSVSDKDSTAGMPIVSCSARKNKNSDIFMKIINKSKKCNSRYMRRI